jgi:tripartite-type tricarboxylate transporter receptor subunit TctC
MLLSRTTVRVLSLSIVLLGTASAQDFPNKPIRIVTTQTGGGSDTTVRIIGPGITGPLGQPIVVENRPSGFIAAEVVAKAPPDGYTLLVTGGSLWILPLLRKTAYEMSEFAAVSLMEWSINMVAVHPSLPVKNIKELIALAKAKPGELNYGSDAVGGRAHLATELFKSMTGVNMVVVTYKGNSPAITALLGGETQVMFTDVSLLAPHVKSGKLRGLAVTSLEPSPMAPGMPTVAQSGVPGYETAGMTGMYAPVKTPAPVINRISQEVARYMARPEIKERFLKMGVEAVGSTPEHFAAAIKADIARVSKVIKDAGIKAE